MKKLRGKYFKWKNAFPGGNILPHFVNQKIQFNMSNLSFILDLRKTIIYISARKTNKVLFESCLNVIKARM